MKIYILKRKGLVQMDEMAALVVVAPSARSARKVASNSSQCEGRAVWLDPNRTSCKQVSVTGEARAIVVDIFEG